MGKGYGENGLWNKFEIMIVPSKTTCFTYLYESFILFYTNVEIENSENDIQNIK